MGSWRGKPQLRSYGAGWLIFPLQTYVQFSTHAAHRNKANFTEPNFFAPERWLGDKHFEADIKDLSQPFSVGPRSCIGRK